LSRYLVPFYLYVQVYSMSQIFLVYTALNQKPVDLCGPDGFRGLGHMDFREDILSILFELTAPPQSRQNSPKTIQWRNHEKGSLQRDDFSSKWAMSVVV